MWLLAPAQMLCAGWVEPDRKRVHRAILLPGLDILAGLVVFLLFRVIALPGLDILVVQARQARPGYLEVIRVSWLSGPVALKAILLFLRLPRDLPVSKGVFPSPSTTGRLLMMMKFWSS